MHYCVVKFHLLSQLRCNNSKKKKNCSCTLAAISPCRPGSVVVLRNLAVIGSSLSASNLPNLSYLLSVLCVCLSPCSKTPHQPRWHRVALEDGPGGENPAGGPGEAPEHDSTVQRCSCFLCTRVLPASRHGFTFNLFNRRVGSPARHLHNLHCSPTPHCCARGLVTASSPKHSLAQAVCLLYRTLAVQLL